MTVGYRVGEPQFTNAKKIIEFEVVDSGNEPMLDDLAAALHCEPTLQSINKALDAQFGSDAIAIWLTDTPNLAEKHYGPGEAYKVKIPPGAIVGVDLGEDGKLWIWRKQGNPVVMANPDFKLGPEIPRFTATLSSDEWRALKRLCEEQLASRRRPKAARGWRLHGLARMAFPEWGWPEGKLYRVMNSLSRKGCCGVHTVKGEPGGYTWSPSPKGWRTYFKYEKATGLRHPEEPEEEAAKVPWRKVFKVKGNPGTVFVEIRMLRDVPPITGSDMKTYGPFRKGRVYAIPKLNARVFIKQGIAKATRKEAAKPTLKEMFKGEVLTSYIEAAKVKPLVEKPEKKKTYAIPSKSWMGEFTANTDEEAVIKQIVHNIKYWKTGICKRDTLEKYCREKGIENVSEILSDLIRRGVVYTPREGYIGLTEPKKYGLLPIEKTRLNTGKLADVFLELLKKAGVSLPSRFKGKFEEALDINKSYEENVKLIEAAAKRIILLEKTERVLGEIREARGA